MDRLADEILQLIINELDSPSSFTRVSKRYYQFSEDPYVRAHYFLSRYGRIQAIYGALGRGRLMNERVIDILLSSGAHLSRYVVQVAIHHYFRSSSPFIKTQWVRSLSFPMFSHFLKVAADKLGDIPTAKGDDDGTIFTSFIKESRYPIAMRSTKVEDIIELLEKYKFIPFCSKDPIMAQFPLALAIEPRLLPLAVANGFHMDCRYRDFVFRRMFERSTGVTEQRTAEILHNVRELCRLDSSMFVSRTVAAEVLMEAQTNESGYAVLKALDRKGELKFELQSVVEGLIKLFVKTRSITTPQTVSALRHLWKDFPSKDHVVRLVLLLTVFVPSPGSPPPTVAALHTKLQDLKLSPLSKQDVHRVLLNPFVDCFSLLLEYSKTYCELTEDEFFDFVKNIAVQCLEIPTKGKMLKTMYQCHPGLDDAILSVVSKEYQIMIDDLPSPEDERACATFEARLCRDLAFSRSHGLFLPTDLDGPEIEEVDKGQEQRSSEEDVEVHEVGVPIVAQSSSEVSELGEIGQETLSQVIRQDELAPARRRRISWMSAFADIQALSPFPSDFKQVGRVIGEEFGALHPTTAVFMTHAVINDNMPILQQYLNRQVPVTLKHFKLLARLGRAPNPALFRSIQAGAEFFFSEEDYLGKNSSIKVKKETNTITDTVPTQRPPSTLSPPTGSSSRVTLTSARGCRRPRRSAAVTVTSYAVPDSDDEEIADEKPSFDVRIQVKKRKVESNLQRWIKHLASVQKEEQKRYNEKKKLLEATIPAGIRRRIPKSDFLKVLSGSLRDLRKADQTKRQQLYGPDAPAEDYSEGDDDEYQCRARPTKRRKTGPA